MDALTYYPEVWYYKIWPYNLKEITFLGFKHLYVSIAPSWTPVTCLYIFPAEISQRGQIPPHWEKFMLEPVTDAGIYTFTNGNIYYYSLNSETLTLNVLQVHQSSNAEEHMAFTIERTFLQQYNVTRYELNIYLTCAGEEQSFIGKFDQYLSILVFGVFKNFTAIINPNNNFNAAKAVLPKCKSGKLQLYEEGDVDELGLEDMKTAKIILKTTQDDNILFSHVTIRHTLEGLRFISCGRPLVSPFAFSELFTVFSEYVWIALIVAVIVVTFSLKLLNRNWKYFMASLKVLLEQGNPFPDTIIENRNFAVLNLLILLTGTVLSNAYKSNNVYNMIAPLSQIPYTKYEQLIRDNFSIHQRLDFSLISYVQLLDHANAELGNDIFGKIFL